MYSLSYKIKLNKDGYEPFLDFLKGVCIIFVILTHCISPSLRKYSLFCLWGDMAVPLFLVVQVFQTYKRGTKNIKINIAKLLKRIVIPFLIAQACGVAILSFVGGISLLSSLRQFGGIGPGDYFPYIYIQFTILLSFLSPFFDKNKEMVIASFFILVSELLELACIYLSVGLHFYIFSFFRYTFLIYLGWLLANDRIQQNLITYILTLVSVVFILSFDGIIQLGVVNLSSVFYDKTFAIFHWISYFYVLFFFLFIIYDCYRLLQKYHFLNGFNRFLMLCGKYSYEIFLFQMIFFLISPVNILFLRFGWRISPWLEPIVLVLNVLCCTVPIFILKNILKSFFKDRKYKTDLLIHL